MEPFVDISKPIIENTEIFDFSTQIETAEDKNIQLFYILYHIAIGVLKITENELVVDFSTHTSQLTNWKPLLCIPVQKTEEFLKTTFKEGIKKVIAISSRIRAWEKIIEQTNKKIDSNLVQASTYLIKLVEIQEEYKLLKLKIERIINEKIPPIKKAFEGRIERHKKEYMPSKESKELIERYYDISLEKFEEHFKYVRKNTEFFKGCLVSLETEAAYIDPAQKFFLSFKSNFKALYKRITESKSEPGVFEYYFGSIPEDNSDPLNDIDMKTVHSIIWKPIKIREKEVLAQAKKEPLVLNIDVERSPIYQFITNSVSNHNSQDYPREIRDFMRAILNAGGREKHKLFHATSDHLEAYQQILLMEPIPETTKKGEILVLINKAKELLKRMNTIEEDTRGERDYITRIMSTIGHVNCRDTQEGQEQSLLLTDHIAQDVISQELIDSSVPVYRLAVLRLSQIEFSKLSEEHFKPLLETIASIQEQLQDHIDFESKKKVSEETVEMIASFFEITEKLNIWNQLDDRREGRDSNVLKKHDADLKTKFEEMKKMVKSYKKRFNESLCTILGVDSWWEKKGMSPIDKPNILKLENVAAFIEAEKNRIETQKNKGGESEESI